MAGNDDLELLMMSLLEKMADKMRPSYLRADRCSDKRGDWKDRGEECMTQQHFKEQLDINNIVKQCVAQGYSSSDFRYLAEQLYADASRFVDVSGVQDVGDASLLAEEARDSFLRNIPAKIREKFNHDPFAFYRFVSNPVNSSAVNQMFSDVRNYSAPTVEQLQDAQQQPPVKSSDGSK